MVSSTVETTTQISDIDADPQTTTEQPFCGICRDDCTNPYTLPCKHVYCTSCIGVWLHDSDISGDTCPTCRAIVEDIDLSDLDFQLLILRLPPYENPTLETIDRDIRRVICGLDWYKLLLVLAEQGYDERGCKCPCGAAALREDEEVIREDYRLMRRQCAGLFQARVDILRSNGDVSAHEDGMSTVLRVLWRKLVIWGTKLECWRITGLSIDHIPSKALSPNVLLPPPPLSLSSLTLPLAHKMYDLYFCTKVALGYEDDYACEAAECDHEDMLAATWTRRELDEIIWRGAFRTIKRVGDCGRGWSWVVVGGGWMA